MPIDFISLSPSELSAVERTLQRPDLFFRDVVANTKLLNVDVADRLGISDGYLLDIEHGLISPSVRLLVRAIGLLREGLARQVEEDEAAKPEPDADTIDGVDQ